MDGNALERCWTWNCFLLSYCHVVVNYLTGKPWTETSWHIKNSKMSPLVFSCDHPSSRRCKSPRTWFLLLQLLKLWKCCAAVWRRRQFETAGNPARQNCQIDPCCFMKMFFQDSWSLQWLHEIHWNPVALCELSRPLESWPNRSWSQGFLSTNFCAYWRWVFCAHVHHVRQDWLSCACGWHELYTADSNHKGRTWLYVYIAVV